jgi:hypothetical protein
MRRERESVCVCAYVGTEKNRCDGKEDKAVASQRRGCTEVVDELQILEVVHHVPVWHM